MSKKNKNPYREGSKYHNLFAFMRKKQVFTRNDLRQESEHLGIKGDGTLNVLLSPRDVNQKGLRGDPRGNFAAKGHVYYVEPLAHKKNEEQRFRLRWREEILENNSRKSSKDENIVKQEKESNKSQVEILSKNKKTEKVL